jgi:pseudouridine-5'-phosphate glycosidase
LKLRLSKEVARAKRQGTPLVALESSVIAQGLPQGHNLQSARACEAAVREAGAIPATIAVIDGALCVGLEAGELERLATEKGLLKVGSRDLAVAVARKATGGTTVSATCELAAAAGVRLFATGGIGGVHRGVAETLDVSQDLPALARFPVGVVCAGAKSVLDLPKTVEALETLGVPLLGVGTRELPGFYTRETGIELEHSVADAREAAAVLEARLALGQGGVLFALPPPEATSLPRIVVEEHLVEALEAARKHGISGKLVTPFLLAELSRRTRGTSLQANLALLRHNAAFAAAVAVALVERRPKVRARRRGA